MAVSLRLDFLYVLRTVLLKSLFLGVSLCGIVWVEVIDDYVRGDEGRFAVLQAEPVHRCLIVIFFIVSISSQVDSEKLFLCIVVQ